MTHASRTQAVQAKAGQVKQHPVTVALGKVAGKFFALCHETIEKFWSDFIGALADRGADDGANITRGGPKRLHGVNGGMQNSVQRAAPPSMGGTDHARFSVGKQHRLAISGQDRQCQPRRCRDQCVRARFVGLWLGEGDHTCGMNLMYARQMIRRHAHGISHAGAVDGNDIALIGAAKAAVQSCIDTRGRPPPAGKEPVADWAKAIGG